MCVGFVLFPCFLFFPFGKYPSRGFQLWLYAGWCFEMMFPVMNNPNHTLCLQINWDMQ